MSKASKKRPRDDIPCVPIGSPVWIVKSWRELPEDRHGQRIDVGISYKEYCMHGVFATLEAANAEARRARDHMVDKYELSDEEEDEGQEEEEGTDEEEEEEEEVTVDEEEKKVNDNEPFEYYRDLGWPGSDDGDLHVVVEKVNVR
jgi:hypothetical protein